MKFTQQFYTRNFLILLAVISLACSNADSKEKGHSGVDTDDFKNYWYAGEAEITRYQLEQARYGEIRKGDAVLIFVTEDFLTDKQVKYEFGDSKNATSILKLNFVKKFYTGIYPYSMMTSVFTPVDMKKQSTLKVTTSSQEWCGHTFMQLNKRDDKYTVTVRSYFQSEGDKNFELKTVLLEDEIWTKIRINPHSLPTGKFEIIPGSQFARLRHIPYKVEKAQAELQEITDKALSEATIQMYSIDYENIERKLSIKFEKNFPHRILAWEESYPSGFGKNVKILTTRAVKTHSIKSNYWARNKLSDSYLRDELGLIY